ncbi:solute carrier family 26 member 6 [Lingula anatina]|uniref:Solute carrier family 26 member 6 n=1 Tax=Lingula anatina TaxID=7574 RepID=A0A1S3JNC8_LINAN|nr:solute carrier family 26 member 6 [Lingula anatina]|eukprot:XP_013411873.1 solute carrier family 26 member 6 [Lingula anatina]
MTLAIDDEGFRSRGTMTRTETTAPHPDTCPDATSKDNRAVDVRKVRVLRPIYSQSNFDLLHRHSSEVLQEKKNEENRSWRKRCACSSGCLCRFLLRLFPFVGILRQYRYPQWLVGDIVAGLTVGVMNLPQGMAYAMICGLPPVHGLYAAFFPTLVYFFFGTSRHISIGSVATSSFLVGSYVDRQTAAWSPSSLLPSNGIYNTSLGNGIVCDVDTTDNLECVDYKINVVVALMLLVGVWQLLKGLLRLGFITNYLSDPLVSGFTTGAACHVFSSQIKHVFGVSVKTEPSPFKLINFYSKFLPAVSQTNLTALIMSSICILTLVLVKECINARFKSKMKVPVPIELLVVILATAVCYLAKLDEVNDVVVVGKFSAGLPQPRVPPLTYFGDAVLESIVIAIVSYSINISLAKMFAKSNGYIVDANQELVAYGLMNVVGAIFTCSSPGAAMSRSCVQETTGGKTQVASVISSVFILIIILFAGPLFETLPKCVLASIIMVALKGMFLQVKSIKRLWGISRFDFAVWIVTFLGVVILDLKYGLMIGVGFSLLTVVFRTQWPYTCLYGRVPHSDIYRDSNIYKTVEEIPGIKIFHFGSSLYYANAEHFRSKLYAATDCDPALLKAKQMKSKEKSEALEKEREKEEKKTQKVECIPTTIKKTTEVNGISNRGMIGLSKEVLSLHIEDVQPDDKLPSEVNEELPPQPAIHHIIVDCSAMAFVDAVGIQALKQIVCDYKDIGVQVVFAHCRDELTETVQKNVFLGDQGRDAIYLTVHDAVLAVLTTELPLLQKLEDDTLITSHGPGTEASVAKTNGF